MRVVICVTLILLSSLLTPFLFGHKMGTVDYGETYFMCMFAYAILYALATVAYNEIAKKNRY